VVRSCGWDGGETNEHRALIGKFSRNRWEVSHFKSKNGWWGGGGGIFKDVTNRVGL